MITRLETLFSLEVRHGYYGGACGDVGFIVPEDVARLMRGAGLQARSGDGVLRVLYQAGPGGGAPVRSAAGKTVRAGLLVQSPSFANITEGFDPRAGTLYYRNGASAGALDAPSAVALCGPSLSWPLARASRPVTVAVEDAAGRALRTETVTAPDGRRAVSFDLTGVEPGALAVEETYADGVVRRSPCSLDPELWREGVLGVVEIAVAPAFYQGAPTFQISFQARQETLRYYVVAKGFSNGDVDQLAVQDQGFGEPGHPDELKFARVPPEQLTAAEKVQADILGKDGARVLLFRSLSAVARQQAGRKRIQLMRSTEPLIENLPQPGRERGTADLIVHLSKSKA
jgi:hypothetical protein